LRTRSTTDYAASPPPREVPPGEAFAPPQHPPPPPAPPAPPESTLASDEPLADFAAEPISGLAAEPIPVLAGGMAGTAPDARLVIEHNPLSVERIVEELVAWLKTLASAAVYATLIVTFGFQVARVEGQSMAPTLSD